MRPASGAENGSLIELVAGSTTMGWFSAPSCDRGIAVSVEQLPATNTARNAPILKPIFMLRMAFVPLSHDVAGRGLRHRARRRRGLTRAVDRSVQDGVDVTWRRKAVRRHRKVA